MIRLTTGSGTLVIETDDHGVKIAIDGEEVTITGGGVESLTLRPGHYTVTALKNGRTVKQELVSITRNGRTVVRLSLEPAPKVASSEIQKSDDKWPGWPADAPPPAEKASIEEITLIRAFPQRALKFTSLAITPDGQFAALGPLG